VQWLFGAVDVDFGWKAEQKDTGNRIGLQQVHQGILNGKPVNFLILLNIFETKINKFNLT
jgi:hypothetical protein